MTKKDYLTILTLQSILLAVAILKVAEYSNYTFNLKEIDSYEMRYLACFFGGWLGTIPSIPLMVLLKKSLISTNKKNIPKIISWPFIALLAITGLALNYYYPEYDFVARESTSHVLKTTTVSIWKVILLGYAVMFALSNIRYFLNKEYEDINDKEEIKQIVESKFNYLYFQIYLISISAVGTLLCLNTSVVSNNTLGLIMIAFLVIDFSIVSPLVKRYYLRKLQ